MKDKNLKRLPEKKTTRNETLEISLLIYSVNLLQPFLKLEKRAQKNRPQNKKTGNNICCNADKRKTQGTQKV